jgi:hypothetical protein
MRGQHEVHEGTQQGVGDQAKAGPLGELSKLQASEVIETVSHLAREYPHATMAGACAVGFILGGGLSPRLLGAIGTLVARKYMQESMRETLEGVIQRAGI